jgi:hypothetical protein
VAPVLEQETGVPAQAEAFAALAAHYLKLPG